MSKKTKYYFIGIAAFIVLIIGYHFYAASQAEQQIDKAIQEQVSGSDSISVQYSSIDVAPFGGSVSMQDLMLIFGDHIERATNLQLNISYFDFLNIYFRGIRSGLGGIERASIQFINPSYANTEGLEEIKIDTLTIDYTGNVLDGLLSAINGTAFNNTHTIEAYGSNLTVSLPKTTLTRLETGELRYSGAVSKGEKNFWLDGSHQFQMDSLVWTPSESFQNKYSFFIKGFGYAVDNIPFQSAKLATIPTPQTGRLKIESTIQSDLALVSGSGFIQLKDEFISSELHDMNLSITDFSDSFNQVLQNIERLLSISLPRTGNGITLQLEGTLSNPRIAGR